VGLHGVDRSHVGKISCRRYIHRYICWKCAIWAAASDSLAPAFEEPGPVSQVHDQMAGISHELTVNMDEPNKWGLPKYLTLIVVLGLHMLLLAMIVIGSRASVLRVSTNPPIELMVISPATPPKIRAENSRPRLSGDTAISIAAPTLDSYSVSSSASGSEGNGSGVNWAAEARRAVRAFDIRSHQPPIHDSLSSSPADDNWWPRTQHRAGDQYKIANGDWIVWINASCYQVAGSGPLAYAADAVLSRTICPGKAGTPAGNPPEPASVQKK
jgi:hypothetical protein